jgi:RND family efflux transporter MFP subunit
MDVTSARRLPGRWLAALTVLIVLVSAACQRSPGADSETGESAHPPLPVQAYTVQRQDITRSVQVSSTVEPLRYVRLAMQTAGILERLDAEAGDVIERGQLLASVDVREQQAELRRAQAELEEERANLERLTALQARGQIDTASVERATTQLARMQAAVDLWQTRVDHGQLRAPLAGTVTERHAEPGESVSQYQTLLTVADTSTMVVRFGFSELDVGRLSDGDTLPVRVDALRDTPELPGRIRRIMPATEGPSRLVTVEVALEPGEDSPLRLGFLARATVEVERREQVLVVPLGSIAGNRGEAYVMTIDENNRLRRREVVMGAARGSWREILEGIEPGEVIATASPADFSDRQRVRVVDWLNGEPR